MATLNLIKILKNLQRSVNAWLNTQYWLNVLQYSGMAFSLAKW